MSRKLKVYVAGPISQGNQFQNCARAIRMGSALVHMGAIPFIPHLTALWDMIDGEPSNLGYEDWLSMDFAWIESCDCLLRISGASSGADREVEHAESLGIPVFKSFDELREFVELYNGPGETDDGEEKACSEEQAETLNVL